MGSCRRVLRVPFNRVPQVLLGGKVGSACEEFQDSEGGVLG